MSWSRPYAPWVESAAVTIWRYPIKSAGAETLSHVEITSSGLKGDRAWGVLRADGTVTSAKHPQPGGRLLHVAVRESEGRVWLAVPDGQQAEAGTAAGDALLSAHLGETVTLSREVEPGVRLHRLLPSAAGMVPDWQEGTAGSAVITAVAGAPGGSYRDFGPVHAVTTGALRRLGEQQGGAVDPLRFRPNLVLDLPDDPPTGSTITLGEVVLTVSFPTPRCLVVPALTQPGLTQMPSLLTTLARLHRKPVGDLGRAACFGFYADVTKAGTVSAGCGSSSPAQPFPTLPCGS